MGLRLKVLLIVIGVTVGAMVAILASTSYLSTLGYSKALQSRALAISNSLKIQLERVLQFGIKVDNLVGFEEQCRDVVTAYEGITYALVATIDGSILFHSDSTQIGRKLSDPVVVDALLSSDPAGTVVYEAAPQGYSATVPVMSPAGQHVASIAVGLAAEQISQEVRKTVRFGLVAGLTVLIVGSLLLTAVLSAVVTRPLDHLIDTITCISNNVSDYSQRVPVHGSNEMRNLIESFNRMLAEIERRDTQLKIAKEQSDDANQAKSQFLARMSHELRTPMNGMLGIVDILCRSPLNPRQRHFLDMARHSGASLLAIVNDILDFSKIEAGKLALDHAEFDLREATEDVAALLAEGAQRKGVEFSCMIAPCLPTQVWGDAWRLRQILVNLISNAVKFTEHGEIVIDVRKDQDDRIRFSVSDTGVGIAPKVAATLFQPFRQADNSTSRRFGGTGLGLAIVKQLVEMQGGCIQMASHPGKGSTFTFVLPLPAAASAAPPHGVLDGMRILAVDKNPTSRAILLQYLCDWGIIAATASTGAQALDTLRAGAANGEPFDLAIVDMALPDMDGLQFAGTVGADSSLGDLRTIFTVTSAENTSDASPQADGAASRLLKPVRYSQLFASITAAVGVGAGRIEYRDTRFPLPPPESGTISAEVLLVEDNAVNQEVTQTMLSAMGCRVTIADDGHRALSILASRRFDAVLMDCHLPALDGYDTTRAFRRREAEGHQPRIPIIALTASAMQGDRERCMACGMDDYLTKPFQFDSLCAVLRRWVCPPAHRPGADETVFPLDPAVLQALHAMQRPDRPDLLKRIIGIFNRDAPRLVARMREGFHHSDAEALREAAHSLKSAGANVGATRLAALCQEIEGLACNADVSMALSPLTCVEAELDRVMAALANQKVDA